MSQCLSNGNGERLKNELSENYEHWYHEQQTTKLVKCREAYAIEQENNRILYKTLLNQEIRKKEHLFTTQLKYLSDTIQSKSHELSTLKEQHNVLVTKLSSKEKHLQDEQIETSNLRLKLEKAIQCQSDQMDAIMIFRRQVAELQTQEFDLTKKLQRANNNIESNTTIIEKLNREKTKMSSLIEAQSSTIDDLNKRMSDLNLTIEGYQRDDIERRRRLERVQHLRELKKNMKRKLTPVVEPLCIQEKRRSELLMKRKDKQILRLQRELQISENQRELYRAMLRGKNICKLLNTAEESKGCGEPTSIYDKETSLTITCDTSGLGTTTSRSRLNRNLQKGKRQVKSIEEILDMRRNKN